jgi:hypothetical protein
VRAVELVPFQTQVLRRENLGSEVNEPVAPPVGDPAVVAL